MMKMMMMMQWAECFNSTIYAFGGEYVRALWECNVYMVCICGKIDALTKVMRVFLCSSAFADVAHVADVGF